LGSLWLFALFIVGFVLVMVLMLWIMRDRSPPKHRRAEAQIDRGGDYSAVGAWKGLRRQR
jgi:hypothetical protein